MEKIFWAKFVFVFKLKMPSSNLPENPQGALFFNFNCTCFIVYVWEFSNMQIYNLLGLQSIIQSKENLIVKYSYNAVAVNRSIL